jgi:tryptophanyl-tRNA synthetase
LTKRRFFVFYTSDSIQVSEQIRATLGNTEMLNKKSNQTFVSGIKATGKLHIGNYFGAIKQFIDLQDDHLGIIFVADLHALTSTHDPADLREDSFNIVLDYISLGLDPSKVIIFKQSDVPEVAELSWIFSCLTSMPYLMRAHAYKDAVGKDKEINAGVFSYPLLMAADILMYDADFVPVGNDQRQHVEIARDTASKFNSIYGETFKLPLEMIKEEVKIVPGTDGRKMSKSYKNTIGIFSDDEVIKKSVMSIVTDSRPVGEPLDPDNDNVFALHSLFGTKEEISTLRERYAKGAIGHRESKEMLLEKIINFVAPFREERRRLLKDRQYIFDVLKEGKLKAKDRAKEKMEDVRKKTGLSF